MNPYIFSKHNPHSWKAKLLLFFILVISVGMVYLAQAYLGGYKAKIEETAKIGINVPIVQAEDKQIEENIPPEQIIDDVPLLDQENKILEKIETPSSPSAKERSNDPAANLSEAMIYTKPQILTGKYIDISLQYQNMVIFEDGKALDSFLISSGKAGFTTPIGTFKIENKYPRAWSKAYSLWMPNWMAILPTGKVGIHELPEWPGGYKEGANHLGTPVSHGCVRLGVGPAKRVYDWADIGTPVIIHK